MNEKETGSFYTPNKLIEYMIGYINNRISPCSILEPSAGDGRFVEYLNKISSNITLVEFDQQKIVELKKLYKNPIKCECSDFITYSLNKKKKYDLIIGNPPYISKKSIPKEQYESSLNIAEYFGLDKSIVQNLWVSFVLSSIKMLNDKGSIFFVLPFEFLQVQYAEKLRIFLEKKFDTIEIITFEERVFTNIEQDICLVYLSNEDTHKPYIKYKTLISDERPIETFNSVIERNKPLKKWSNCILDDTETENFMNLASLFPMVSEFGEISPGIVTGANSFFILPNKKIDDLKISKSCTIPIITKSSNVSSVLIYKTSDFDLLISDDVPTQLVNLNGTNIKSFSKHLREYLNNGELKDINKGFKCKNRKRWYDVPIIKNGQVCFFKRYHIVPKIIFNEANVYTTDISYNIRFNDQFDPKSFVFCFYNSLTIALCEYNGRFYGGGVAELVPSEFKQLNIPYKRIPEEQITQLDNMFRNNESFENIVEFVDSIVLNNLSNEEKLLLKRIRQKYLLRRMKDFKRRNSDD